MILLLLLVFPLIAFANQTPSTCVGLFFQLSPGQRSPLLFMRDYYQRHPHIQVTEEPTQLSGAMKSLERTAFEKNRANSLRLVAKDRQTKVVLADFEIAFRNDAILLGLFTPLGGSFPAREQIALHEMFIARLVATIPPPAKVFTFIGYRRLDVLPDQPVDTDRLFDKIRNLRRVKWLQSFGYREIHIKSTVANLRNLESGFLIELRQ